VFLVLLTIMPEPATINDLLDKSRLDNPKEEASAASKLRQERMGRGGDDPVDRLISLAGGVGGMGADNRRMADDSKKDNLGRPIGSERSLPASRQTSTGKQESGPGMARQSGGQSGGDLDSRLMAGRSGQLREEKNKERERRGKEGEKGEETEKGEKGEEAKEGGGLRDRVSQLKEKANFKKRAQKKIEEKVTDSVKQGTNRLLKNAWLHLIDSFGLTLIYINMHVFLRWVFPDLFCKLGEEWMPKIVAGKSSAKNVGGTAFGIVEVIGLLILDLIALTIIASVLTLLVMIVDFMGKGFMGKVGAVVSGITTLGWGAVMALFNLFKDL